MVAYPQIFDLMGYEPSHYNKINIHIGGVYGDKPLTLERFAAFSVRDLLPMSQQTGTPIVFDFHHHRFCSGEGLAAAGAHVAFCMQLHVSFLLCVCVQCP